MLNFLISNIVLTGTGAVIAGAAAATGAAAGIGSGIYNTVQSRKAYKDYRDDIAVQRRREDTAIQRRVADLRAAGLNPLLAAHGDGAGTTQASQANPAEMANFDMLSHITALDQLKTSAVQRDLLKEEVKEKQIENEYREERLSKENSILSRTDRIQSQLEHIEVQFRRGQLHGQRLDHQIQVQIQETNRLKHLIMGENLSQEQINTFMREMDQGIRYLLREREISAMEAEYYSEVLKSKILQVALDTGTYNLNWSRLHNRRTGDRANQGLEGIGRDIAELFQ